MVEVTISGENFLVDGGLVNEGRRVLGVPVDGLLMNSRMINGIFDDANPGTRGLWKYPDTGEWDAERNVREFLAQIPVWKEAGLDAITLGLQGGSPRSYSKNKEQPWDNAAFTPAGELLPAYADRLGRVLGVADDVGLIVMVNVFYFGQDDRLQDESAVRRALVQVSEFLLRSGHRNVLVDVANECDIKYHHPVLLAPRIHELIALAKSVEVDGRRLLVSSSFTSKNRPTPAAIEESDFVLVHGNTAHDPAQITNIVDDVRATRGYRPMPVVFNEDDHFDFGEPVNNFVAALRSRASWGYFDPGTGGSVESGFIGNYHDGYQAPPIDWSIGSPRKKAFFAALR
jgi:hypothetical protein